jgi:hypothetical protein
MIYAVIVVFCFWCVAAVIDSGGQIYSYLTSPSAVRFHKKCINNVGEQWREKLETNNRCGDEKYFQ